MIEIGFETLGAVAVLLCLILTFGLLAAMGSEACHWLREALRKKPPRDPEWDLDEERAASEILDGFNPEETIEIKPGTPEHKAWKRRVTYFGNGAVHDHEEPTHD